MLPPLREALGNVALKFRGTGLMLLVVQLQAQMLTTTTVECVLTQVHEHDIHWLDWATSFDKQQLALLDVSLVLYWCFFVSVANATVWKAQCKVEPLPIANSTVRKAQCKVEPLQMPLMDDDLMRHDDMMRHGY